MRIVIAEENYVIDIKKTINAFNGEATWKKVSSKVLPRLLRPISYQVFPLAKENANFCYFAGGWGALQRKLRFNEVTLKVEF